MLLELVLARPMLRPHECLERRELTAAVMRLPVLFHEVFLVRIGRLLFVADRALALIASGMLAREVRHIPV